MRFKNSGWYFCQKIWVKNNKLFQTKIYDHIKKSSYTEYQMNDESYLSDFKEY